MHVPWKVEIPIAITRWKVEIPIAGCKVIGFAGADDKVDWLREIGADHAFNYKKVKVGEALRQAAPEKINCYFDNVSYFELVCRISEVYEFTFLLLFFRDIFYVCNSTM